MEILSKNNIGICFCSKFSSMESIINHSHDRISMVIRHAIIVSRRPNLLKNRAWLDWMFTLPHIKIELWSKV